jgi:hypothetical protein
MDPMRAWSVLVSADRFAAERLYHHDVLHIDGLGGASPLRDGDQVALIADVTPPVVFAVARVEVVANGSAEADDSGGGALALAYTQRFFDEPRPAADLMPTDGPVREIRPAAVTALGVIAEAPRTWLVSLDLPIEARSAAEAVRQFWTYVRELGPTELPVYLSPSGDELAMQAFVLGAEANQDPEED